MNPEADTLTTADGRTALVMRRRLAHPPAAVWAAITEPKQLAQWFPSEVSVELRPGGTMGFHFPGEEGPGMTGRVTDADAPHVFAFAWGEDHLRWEITPDGDGSLLTLTHTFGDRFGGASFASGWHLCLTALGQLLDGERIDVEADRGELHEAYLEQFDLGRGEIEGTTVRFERQLLRPADAVWSELAGGASVSEGATVPPGFTAPSYEEGYVTEVREPEVLAYRAPLGELVRWKLGEGTGHGARLVLTVEGSGDPRRARDAWHERIEHLAARMLELASS
ncbi:SRPBCC domain-containing protein [Streptomyces sp. TRM66268-LWL]|uniref:SRPBCC domain-containing protein n=1 Tax=Streptomyces polyasparticus TaxID=2767826 RepID=A0ABR7SHS2_9ACTN|nr:SRPBCC family protein [Streptomyces polyasparticus]MBC9715066.1 SRPBCC domain-containing protein [Streptomyces polyasparticus]